MNPILMLPPGLVITLENLEHGWKITYGDQWEDHLGRDEALGTIAEIIYTGKAHYLKTQPEHDEWDKKYGTHHD